MGWALICMGWALICMAVPGPVLRTSQVAGVWLDGAGRLHDGSLTILRMLISTAAPISTAAGAAYCAISGAWQKAEGQVGRAERRAVVVRRVAARKTPRHESAAVVCGGRRSVCKRERGPRDWHGPRWKLLAFAGVSCRSAEAACQHELRQRAVRTPRKIHSDLKNRPFRIYSFPLQRVRECWRRLIAFPLLRFLRIICRHVGSREMAGGRGARGRNN